MPIYTYEVVATGEIFEIEHAASVPAPTAHPETGQEIRRVYTAPHIGSHYAGNYSKNILSNDSLGKSGFSKYVRDPLTGRYNKEVGKFGPEQLRPKG